tara:strand:+ start:178 stop:546 length:369 start_codon:yes stop_codon:yes gene_type:complete
MNNNYLFYKIKSYLELNNSSSIDMEDLTNLELRDDGSGPYIYSWNINLQQPTQEQLDTTENITRADQMHSSSLAIKNRIRNYPNLGDQFDMLYHELATSGSLSVSGSWFRSIQNVKDSYPKL